MAKGTIRVEFAGTINEAKEFAGEHGLHFVKRHGTKPNGFPYISNFYGSQDQFVELRAKFEQLGWDRHSQIACHY